MVKFILTLLITTSFGLFAIQTEFYKSPKTGIINERGTTIQSRFNPPAGYYRKKADTNSFATYLRNIPLKPIGSKVKYYNGAVKAEEVYDAVVNMDLENKDLQQCADAIMRLRAEYFYSHKQYDKITFNFTNGFKANYSEWIKGKRIVVSGNYVSWKQSAEPANTYKMFRNYMDIVMAYAGTLSLSKSLKHKSIQNMTIGDVFIQGGSPGHAEIVVDIAENTKGEKVFLLAQGYMPAQDTQILKNPNNAELSPWYSISLSDPQLTTPQWSFTADELMGWE